ncbi:hypothetical protein [Stackebrandtia albiflava]|uniref:hypothetical protein n=1 Tax=Stackebrandtia albiflava TaxID=406432 RepID=UPI0011BD8165|nr:hypothetical protein [Stackebrandtia albiflava]
MSTVQSFIQNREFSACSPDGRIRLTISANTVAIDIESDINDSYSEENFDQHLESVLRDVAIQMWETSPPSSRKNDVRSQSDNAKYTLIEGLEVTAVSPTGRITIDWLGVSDFVVTSKPGTLAISGADLTRELQMGIRLLFALRHQATLQLYNAAKQNFGR